MVRQAHHERPGWSTMRIEKPLVLENYPDIDDNWQRR